MGLIRCQGKDSMTSLKVIARLSLCTFVLTGAAWGQTPVPPPYQPAGRTPGPPPYPQAGPPRPGSINSLEGDVSIGTMPVTPGMVGSAVLERDQALTTRAGKVEVLLTPGVFLRVAENSSVKMISPDLANTRVQLDKGRALVEVLEIRDQNDIEVLQSGGSTKLLKKGLYEFDADHAQVRVFKGKADVTVANQKVGLGENRETTLTAGGKPKSQSFDPKMFEDDFYRWASLRSGYLSEASVSAARAYMGSGPGVYGPGWSGFGWYWDPWFGV